MNKKILIGSIIAVVILVLVSFTGVVGYQTTSSTIAKASPLFSVRSSRAIDKESKEFTCDYVGKGEESILSIPKIGSKSALIQKAIDRISKMDDETLNRFIKLFIHKIQYSSEFKDMNVDDIINSFYLIKNNPDVLKNNLIDEKDDNLLYTKSSVDDCYTRCPGQGNCFSLVGLWKPGCVLEHLLEILKIIVFWPYFLTLVIIDFIEFWLWICGFSLTSKP